MAVLDQILEGITKGRALYENVQGSFSAQSYDWSEGLNGELYLGDNAEYMRNLLRSGHAGAFSLIYIDPPFFTRSSFNASLKVTGSDGKDHKVHHLAYDDKFDRNLEYYIENMTLRLLMMKDLLADDGLMWIHLDWHSSHYIRLVMDELMGEKNFVNEIIWCYKSGGSGKKHFARKHDSILVYSKTSSYYIDIPCEKSYNREYKPYRFKGVTEYQDEEGWYTLVNMKDVWNIDMVGRTSAERTGYATQKPLELMRRIIESSTKEGDLAGDFFCGSGSFLEAAGLAGRRFVGCDSERLASAMSRLRLKRAGLNFRFSSEPGESTSIGRANIKILSKDELENGKYLYKCSLIDFLPDIDTGSIQMKDRAVIDDALKSDRLQFADHVMIDSGESSDECRQIEGINEGEISFTSGKNPEITIVDIFGREYPAEIV